MKQNPHISGNSPDRISTGNIHDLFTNVLDNWLHPYVKKKKDFFCYITPYTYTHTMWIKDLNIKNKALFTTFRI